MRFILVYLALTFTIESSFDSTDVTVCEHQDANITWPNTTTNSVVEAQAWYKGNTTPMAKWRKEDGIFDVYPQYTGRLIRIGQTGIILKKANRSDSGTYLLIRRMEGANYTSDSTTSLRVIVAPSRDCVPNISRKGDSLWAELSQQGCGSPSLTPEWKNCTQTLTNDTISILTCKLELVPGRYTVCSNGISLHCFQENETNLCSYHTVSASQHQNQNSSVPVEGLLILIIFVIGLFYCVCMNLNSIKRKLCSSTKQNLVLHNRTDRNPLMQEETSGTASIEQSLVVHNSTEGNTLIHEEASATVAAEASSIPHKHSNENPLILKETPATALSSTMAIERDRMMTTENNNLVVGLTLPLGDIARVNEINVKIVFNETQMEQKQRHDPGLTDTREDSKEGNQAFQSSEDPTHEEQCITTKKDDIMPEERQNLCGTCHREDACMILIPCGHIDACYSCAKRLDKCTKCKKKVQLTIKAFCQKV